MTNVNPENGDRGEEIYDAEYLDETGDEAGSESAAEYRGAHRAREEAPAAGSTAAGSTAAVAGGIPKRGLGMILIAVAAILLLWGVYALTQKDPGSTDSAGSAAPSSSSSAGAPGSSAAGSAPASAPASSQVPGAPSPSEAPGGASQSAPAGSPQAAPALTRENAEVLVFNNSPTPDLAGQTAGKLAPDFKVANKSDDAARMNLPEQNFGIFPETYVFFDPAVGGAEQVAADIAQRVGGKPRSVRDLPEGASLPREATSNGNALTVVLAG
ncbi:hypothetical protein [uncultured Corynebacterium sp.]|mgnify:CR=1 FL=1|uniref:hypothetical protein n=1 Tax=uncultured Corynebacterium sp. TaxID=159447 RepID=UPI0025963623|nr:hypothetical protein [uncultured Corynebacterium sp.]